MADYRRNNSHISVCNRLMVEKILPHAVSMFNAGNFGKDYFIFQERAFYKEIISKAFSASIAEEFTEGIGIERGRLPRSPYFLVIKLILPHNNEVGDTEIATILIDTSKNLAASFCLERSLRDYMICEWAEGKHFNYGGAKDFKSFFSSIIKLTEKQFNNIKPPTNHKDNFKSNEYPKFQKGQHIKKDDKSKSDWQAISAYCALAIMVGLVVFILATRCGSDTLDKSLKSTDELLVDTVYDIDTVPTDVIEKDAPNEAYFPYDDKKYAQEMEDLVGETFVYHPEDGSIRTSSGRIVSEGAPAESYTKRKPSTKASAPKASTPSSSSNVYEGVEITHYQNGECPYYNAYGRGRFDSSSLSKLGISNKTNTDAVLLLCDTRGEVIRNVFVKKGLYLTIKNIPSCRCIMKVMFGNDWYQGKDNGSGFPKGGFIKDVSYTVSKWTDAFDFIPQYVEDGIDYPTYEITLHAVRNGNFQTKASNKNEFFNNN